MFERDKIGEEILIDMDKNLRRNAFKEDTRRDQERLQAVTLLHKAAECFENSGLPKEAEAITRVAQFVVVQKDKATEGLTPKKEVENLKQHGHQLNLPPEIASKAKEPEYNDAAVIEINDENESDDLEGIGRLWEL